MLNPLEEAKSIVENDTKIITPKTDTQIPLSRYEKDLFFETARRVIIDALIPVVEAAPKDLPPKKPPPMKYKDLPIYETPHYDYKEYTKDQEKCPNSNVKILHTYLYPKVIKYRRSMSNSFYGLKNELVQMRKEFYAGVCKRIAEFKKYMRAPENLDLRKGVVALGTATGCYIGSGSRNISKKLFFSSLGALAAGALCFPKETDEIFRDISYMLGKSAVALYNSACGKNYVMRERLPCPEDIPPKPKPRSAAERNVCDKKK